MFLVTFIARSEEPHDNYVRVTEPSTVCVCAGPGPKFLLGSLESKSGLSEWTVVLKSSLNVVHPLSLFF